MKKRFFLSAMLLMLLSGIVMLSCSKDDDDNDNNGGSDNLYGYWLRNNTGISDSRFHYFEFSANSFRRVVVEQDEDGNIIDKETETGTITVDGNEVVLKGNSGDPVTYKDSADKHRLTLKMIDPISGNVKVTTTFTRVSEAMFDKMWNAKVENPWSLNKQWMTMDVKTVSASYDTYFSALVLDLTDPSKVYLIGNLKETTGSYIKGKWYLIAKMNYNVLSYGKTTGKIIFGGQEYTYVLSKTGGSYTLDLTDSNNNTAHYDAVIDIEPEGEFAL